MTQTDNGQVAADFEVEIEDGPRRYLPTLLTPRDMHRAKKALADILDGRSAYDMLEDDDDRVPFTIWCLESRNNPGFTWDDALDTPYLGEWKDGPAGPPTTAAPPAGGAKNAAPGSSRKPNERGPAPSSASGTA
jgi:hypothetical protein